uniref:Uncharacterized protein n=1 Tax=Chromera velia CCMP2878 TaxID=1169474 RepID=A0A0G4HK52_9ALVE|mmetsp:Transcript_6944/g.13650  ORF Transcript_6944/g.13650 Transcript_6944/m.13650 type:complete len:295 (+) Transcript_6944:79-963(+)|eukprot:Cvel_7234.t1-p1 / transcript=Cvel_7234.t1 / gene=Cvel_7234 / organism=Chromera_velia_CCMP2878 / gene_product=hypothetical protein / transcript_product=hypothetical protein / location=Cvel_scaffold373:36278-37242(-) / protein_length=294 / sequence_SO=supercontig / SO=protein_coding / is_pseudo=false
MPAEVSDEGSPEHYSTVATTYEGAFFYEDGSPYQQFLLEKTLLYLDLQKDDFLVDIGGGTGNFTEKVYRRTHPSEPILVVDPFADMLEKAERREGLRVLCKSAVDFAEETAEGRETETGKVKTTNSPGRDLQPSKVLMKEMIHHIAEEQYERLFKGLLQKLKKSGQPRARVVIMTRPKEVTYPFPSKAYKVFAENQPGADRVCQAAASAGFFVKVFEEKYQASVPKEQWLQMIRVRFWSTFSHAHFSEEELEAGVKEVEDKLKDKETADFDDTILFLVFSVREEKQKKSLCLIQ